MPIYEYVCDACGNEFEAMQKFSDKPLTTCTCGKSGKVHRKLSAPSFHLQGGGWYNEGYSGKKDGAKSTAKASDSSASKSDASAPKADSTTKKSETKAAATA